jgi:ABC-2 type transport system ATP-binding protein
MDAEAIRIDSLRLRAGSFELAINDWSAARGARVALIGRNGCGKTSILDSLLGLRRDAEIRATLLGHDVAVWSRRPHLRQRLGVLLQRTAMPPGLYVREIVALHQNLYRRSSPVAMESLAVAELANKVFDHLSRGEQQRVELFFALAHEPELIVLDEPFTGLDQRMAQVTANILGTFTASTVLMACHSELELSMADSMVWVQNGLIRECGHPAALRRELVGDFRLQISFYRQEQAAAFASVVAERLQMPFLRFKSHTEVLLAGDESAVRSASAMAAAHEVAALQYGPTTLGDLLYCCAQMDSAPEVELTAPLRFAGAM